MNAYKDAEAYAAELVAKGYTPEDIIVFANTLIEHAFTAHPTNVTPNVVANKDRFDIIEQALSKLALMTGLNELSQHVEATYCEEGLIRKSNTIDVDELYNAFKSDGDDENEPVGGCINNVLYDMEYGEMCDERAMYVQYVPIYDEFTKTDGVNALRETIAKQMANLNHPYGVFGTTY